MEGQIAVVTGASSGIGRAIALALARRGVGLYLVGRDRKRLVSTMREALGRVSQVWAHDVDLTDDDALRRLVRTLREEAGGADILVHSLGGFTSGRIESAPVEELDALYRTNVRSTYLLTQQLLPDLRSRGAGQVVFVNSSIVAGARAGVGQYAASKLALKGLADSLRDEVNGQGIRVLSVYPGKTATPMQASIYAAEERPYEPENLLQPEDVAEIVLAALLLPWTAEVTDIHVRPMRKG
ncbi:MAG TPA: SDR family NAD(P)-dependent oxidoreductase [Pseudomonadales bacterium]|nr:SDR family NAD(P)-dependent oxidoreductase [Pseudomonadales bacterium]